MIYRLLASKAMLSGSWSCWRGNELHDGASGDHGAAVDERHQARALAHGGLRGFENPNSTKPRLAVGPGRRASTYAFEHVLSFNGQRFPLVEMRHQHITGPIEHDGATQFLGSSSHIDRHALVVDL